MNTRNGLTAALAVMTLACGQLAFAQAAPADAAPPPTPPGPIQEVKTAKTARVVIEWATIFDVVAMSKTEISVDQAAVCKINAKDRICDIRVEPGKREIALNTNLDLGTYSERYDVEAGKRYKLEVVMNKKNVLVDSLFMGLPVSAMFNAKGKTATLKFELVDVSDEPQQ